VLARTRIVGWPWRNWVKTKLKIKNVKVNGKPDLKDICSRKMKGHRGRKISKKIEKNPQTK